MAKTKKKAIIIDLDNTVYPVASIGEEVFADLFQIIELDGNFDGDFEDVKHAIQRQPFQVVARDFHFSEDLLEKGMQHLEDLQYNKPVKTFEGFDQIRASNIKKFLVTTGFEKLQWSKIRQLNLEKDFEKCFVVDPSKSDQTKKDIFAEILQDYDLQPQEVLVLGDDLESEIQAGQELGIDTVVFDYNGEYTNLQDHEIIDHYKDLQKYL